MTAAAVAVSGRARTASLWLNLVERLVVGADDRWLRRGSHRSVQALEESIRDGIERCGAVLGRANPDAPKRRWPPARSHQRT